MTAGKTSARTQVLEWARTLAVTAAIVLVPRTVLCQPFTIPSASMEPTLLVGDYILVNKFAYGWSRHSAPLSPAIGHGRLMGREPARGDVVVFKSPVDGERLIKRVVAVGGDTVSVIDGHVSINGQPLASAQAPDVEQFGARFAHLGLEAGGGPDVHELTLPPGQVLVMGDHRGRSFDGRFFGLVPARALYARALGVYWRSGGTVDV